MAQIFTMVPDSVLIEIQNLATAKEIWEVVCAKHEMKAFIVKVDMWCWMYEMRCKDELNVHTHFETLMSTQEQLAGMNATLTDNDLVTVILGSLHKSYHSLINAITMSATHAKVKLEPEHVVRMLVDEFKQLEIEDCQSKARKNALAATKACTKVDIECWKCGKKGHVKAECCSKAKKRDDDKEGSRSANIATESEEFAFTTTFAGNTLVLGTSLLVGQEINVYDSGASGHMLLSQHHFTTFREIAPCAINTADKTIFQATGIGNMRISIPNGKMTMHVTLKNVPYCPDLAFTLVSLTCCNTAGYLVLLKNGKCLI